MTTFFEDLSQRERLSEIKPPLQNQLCMQRRIFQENNPLLSQNTKSQSDDDFLGCCPSPVYLILGSSWDPLVPDPAFDRHFPSYWMDKCKTSSMISKCGKFFFVILLANNKNAYLSFYIMPPRITFHLTF